MQISSLWWGQYQHKFKYRLYVLRPCLILDGWLLQSITWFTVLYSIQNLKISFRASCSRAQKNNCWCLHRIWNMDIKLTWNSGFILLLSTFKMILSALPQIQDICFMKGKVIQSGLLQKQYHGNCIILFNAHLPDSIHWLLSCSSRQLLNISRSPITGFIKVFNSSHQEGLFEMDDISVD